uniref:Uncharacterized protein n=1 Tax=Pinguiococcus pyrenoidosus TaxID=172671 RepID=A0A7R9UFX2_9STRA|mmetsp:Transcript_9378/g.35114  ORF Transcript_9378/g.35114 Transcript_9378/m.35114 type:complete len:562 (+) Transcript_9378:152-1837(+)
MNLSRLGALLLALLGVVDGFLVPTRRPLHVRPLLARKKGGSGFGKKKKGNSVDVEKPEVVKMDEAEAPKVEDGPQSAFEVTEKPTLGSESRQDRKGRDLLDVLTSKPVAFPLAPAERFQAMWNEPSAADVAEFRLPLDSTFETRLKKLQEVVDKEDDDLLLRFVNANMHLYSVSATRAISALKGNAMGRGDQEEAKRYRLLCRKVMAADGSLNTVFHVDVLDRQTDLGDYLGRTDVEKFIGTAASEIVPSWFVIKAVTSAWEDKYTKDTVDAQTAAKRRELRGEGSGLRIAEKKAISRAQTTVLAMQSMAQAFREQPSLMSALPMECVFLEKLEAEDVDPTLIPKFAEDFLDGRPMEDLIIGLMRVKARLDTVRLTRSFRLYSWYVRNVIDVLAGKSDAWDGVYDGPGEITPYRINDGFSWQRSPSVPSRNWKAVEENLELLQNGKGGNPQYYGYGDPSRDDDVDVLGVILQSFNPFSNARAADEDGRGSLPGYNQDPLDEELPFGGNWLWSLDDEEGELFSVPEYTQEQLDEMIKDYDPESELRDKAREGANQVGGEGGE